MNKAVGVLGSFGAAILIGLSICGCGSSASTARPDIDAISNEEHYGTTAKRLLYEFRAKVRKRGVNAAKSELPILLENFASYQSQPLGDQAATYKEIIEKLKALEGTLASANRDAVVKVAEEVGTLADKLPGKADSNPQVE